jgi:hypothetical protein
MSVEEPVAHVGDAALATTEPAQPDSACPRIGRNPAIGTGAPTTATTKRPTRHPRLS